jgi:hypothetical protein
MSGPGEWQKDQKLEDLPEKNKDHYCRGCSFQNIPSAISNPVVSHLPIPQGLKPNSLGLCLRHG